MISIGVIDNGVNESLYVPKIPLTHVNMIGKLSDSEHGTKCASIISKYTSNIHIVDLQVMISSEGDIKLLCKALDWCISNNIKVINISCGTHYCYLISQINRMIKKAYNNQIIIIASGSNDSKKSYPAELKGVIGVKTCSWLNNDEYYAVSTDCFSKGINIVASSNHILTTRDGVNINTPLCNSYAAPCITAKICDYLRDYNCSDKINESIFDYISKCLIKNQSRSNTRIKL